MELFGVRSARGRVTENNSPWDDVGGVVRMQCEPMFFRLQRLWTTCYSLSSPAAAWQQRHPQGRIDALCWTPCTALQAAGSPPAGILSAAASSRCRRRPSRRRGRCLRRNVKRSGARPRAIRRSGRYVEPGLEAQGLLLQPSLHLQG